MKCIIKAGTRIPRKLKKKVKKYCWVHWDGFTNRQRLWYYMEKDNKAFKENMIQDICKRELKK